MHTISETRFNDEYHHEYMMMNIKESLRNISTVRKTWGGEENYSQQSISLNIFMFASSLLLLLSSYLILRLPSLPIHFSSNKYTQNRAKDSGGCLARIMMF